MITVKSAPSVNKNCKEIEVSVYLFYMLNPYSHNFSYENGRVKQNGDKPGQCGLSIDKAKDTDNGKWQCNLSVQGQGGNSIAETRDVIVTVAGKFFILYEWLH